jgi:hypothetical protein
MRWSWSRRACRSRVKNARSIPFILPRGRVALGSRRSPGLWTGPAIPGMQKARAIRSGLEESAKWGECWCDRQDSLTAKKPYRIFGTAQTSGLRPGGVSGTGGVPPGSMMSAVLPPAPGTGEVRTSADDSQSRRWACPPTMRACASLHTTALNRAACNVEQSKPRRSTVMTVPSQFGKLESPGCRCCADLRRNGEAACLTPAWPRGFPWIRHATGTCGRLRHRGG